MTPIRVDGRIVVERVKDMFVVLAKPVDQAFVLNPEKAKEFLERKADPKIKEMHLKRAEEFRKNMVRDDRFKK